MSVVRLLKAKCLVRYNLRNRTTFSNTKRHPPGVRMDGPMPPDRSPLTPVRFPLPIAQRADRLVPRVSGRREFTARRASRSSVLRVAALIGLDILEREHGRSDA